MFGEDQEKKMIVNSIDSKPDRLHSDYFVLSKIGEGSFGEAFKVQSSVDGNQYAVKKSKEIYNGECDRR